MRYSRADVRSALAQAKAAGKDCEALHSDARDTEITLEKWGFLPRDNERLDARVADWYVSQGLALRAGDVSEMSDIKVPLKNDVVVGVSSSTDAAMTAAEAALTAAQAALSLARQIAPPPQVA